MRSARARTSASSSTRPSASRGARSRGITVANRAVAAAALLAVLLGIGSTPSPAADSGPAFDVVKGERFAVILPSNHTTGFQWQLGRPLDGNVVKLVGSEYRAHDNHLA